MKILHLIGGKEEAGSKNHLLGLLKNFKREEIILGVFEKGAIYKEAMQLGIDVRHFGQNTRYDFSVVSSAVHLIQSENISIMHTHGPRANLFGYFIKLRKNIIWTTTVHSDPRYDFIDGGIKGKVFTAINLKILKKTDHCFAISNRFHDILRELGVKSDITTIYNGIDFNLAYDPHFSRESLNLSNEDFVLITVGRLHPIKGHKIIFKALKNIGARVPKLKLLVVGNGPLENELKSMVKEYDLESQVSFLGFQSEEKVPSLLELSDLFILSSYSESFPLVVLEAARAKLPVISTDVGGVRDMITDESLGWVIDTDNADMLGESIISAFQNRESIAAVGENLFEKASGRYSDTALSEKVHETYRYLLKI